MVVRLVQWLVVPRSIGILLSPTVTKSIHQPARHHVGRSQSRPNSSHPGHVRSACPSSSSRSSRGHPCSSRTTTTHQHRLYRRRAYSRWLFHHHQPRRYSVGRPGIVRLSPVSGQFRLQRTSPGRLWHAQEEEEGHYRPGRILSFSVRPTDRRIQRWP